MKSYNTEFYIHVCSLASDMHCTLYSMCYVVPLWDRFEDCQYYLRFHRYADLPIVFIVFSPYLIMKSPDLKLPLSWKIGWSINRYDVTRIRGSCFCWIGGFMRIGSSFNCMQNNWSFIDDATCRTIHNIPWLWSKRYYVVVHCTGLVRIQPNVEFYFRK